MPGQTPGGIFLFGFFEEDREKMASTIDQAMFGLRVGKSSMAMALTQKYESSCPVEARQTETMEDYRELLKQGQEHEAWDKLTKMVSGLTAVGAWSFNFLLKFGYCWHQSLPRRMVRFKQFSLRERAFFSRICGTSRENAGRCEGFA